MTIYKIRFSHDYVKLHDQHHARLLATFTINIGKERLESDPLLLYDTLTVEGKRFRLGTGQHVLLLFLGDKGIPFTTIRPRRNRQGMDKLTYYHDLIGEDFEITIKKDKE